MKIRPADRESHPYLDFVWKQNIGGFDEVMIYLNQTGFGKQGFTENRIFGGLSYQLSDHMGQDKGYMGQYVDNKAGNNFFTHNLQANISYKFYRPTCGQSRKAVDPITHLKRKAKLENKLLSC